MTVKLRLLNLCLLLPLILSGCTAISALEDASKPLEIYELRTPQLPRSASRRDLEIVVQEPSASGALATERIMIRPAPLQAQYLPGVRWSDTAPVMLQTLIVRSLTETAAFGSVGRSPVGTIADFTVLSELTDFQAETLDDGRRAVIRTRLVVRLIRESDRKTVGTQAFSIVVNAGGTDPNTIAAAFDQATSRLLTEAVSWIIASMSRS
jgi:cholesterol transport system auxiliary component